MQQYSLQEQIKCVAREIALRKSAYPKWVLSGRMKQDEATRQTELMTAVLRTLEVLEQYGGIPAVKHNRLSQLRYRERMLTDEDFRRDRLQYFKEYYQRNKERIKLRNIRKGLV